MTIRRPVTLPAITPTSWELRLPGYPVITNSWRSSSFPEILGSLPSGAKWALFFESMDSAEALALLLPWRATAGGQWSLTALPIELAGGVNSADFRKRLTGTTWAIASPPRKEPVKNGRFNVSIELVHELTFESVYGPGRPTVPEINDNPVLLNIAFTLLIGGLPTATAKLIRQSPAGPVLSLNLSQNLQAISSLPATLEKETGKPVEQVIALNISNTLQVAGLPFDLVEYIAQRNSGDLLALSLALELQVIATVPA